MKTVVYVNNQGNDVEINDTPDNRAAAEAGGWKEKQKAKRGPKPKDS